MPGNIPKLLRTLIEYDADLLIVPSAFHPRIQHGKNWHEVTEHPALSTDEIIKGIKESFGEINFQELEAGRTISNEYKGSKLEASLQKLSDGLILMVKRV